MNNVLAIGVVLTSLLAAAVLWSPSTHDQEVIVKEGHRVVVVEYDKESDGRTKVVISPQADVSEELAHEGKKFSELVCDAYGKCKHKIVEALGKTKDKIEDKAQEVTGKVKDEGIGKAKKVMETVKEGAVKALDSADTLQGDISRNVTGRVEDVVKETVGSVQKVSEIKNFGERLKQVTHDVIWYMVSRDKIAALVGLVHMLGFSTAYGMCVWVSFISTYILGRYLPRQQFGLVQSRIQPVYYKAMAYCVSAALFGHLVSQDSHQFQALVLLFALLTVITNMCLLEPTTTKTLHEKMKIEKEEGRGVTRDGVVAPATVVRPIAANTILAERPQVLRLNEKLKRLNAYTFALNLTTLVGLTLHMAYMGRRLHATR